MGIVYLFNFTRIPTSVECSISSTKDDKFSPSFKWKHCFDLTAFNAL